MLKLLKWESQSESQLHSAVYLFTFSYREEFF